jgi:branched-chain amino acid transport system substrate-binding protein
MRAIGVRAFAAAAVGAVLALAACTNSGSGGLGASSGGGTAATSGDIVIGAAIGKTGWLGPVDGPPLAAMKLYFDQVNAAGGINGRKIKLIEADTASDQAKAKQAAESLLGQGAQIIVTSCNFDYGAPAGLVAQAKNILNVSLCAGSARYGVQGIGAQAYTFGIPSYLEGYSMADLTQKHSLKRPFLLTDVSIDYSREVCDGFKTRWGQLGGALAGEDQFKNADTSFTSQISKIRSSNADSVVVCTYTPGGAVTFRALRAGGVDQTIISDFGMTGTFWLDAIPTLSNYYAVAPASMSGDDPDPKINDFVKDLTAKAGDQGGFSVATLGYTAAQATVEAIREAGSTDGAALTAKLDTFKDKPFLLKTTFTPTTHINIGMNLRAIKYVDGKPSYDGTIVETVPIDLKLGG